MQSGEGCDDANTVDDDACTNSCALPRCGDSIVQSDEACDDGNLGNDDACTSACALPIMVADSGTGGGASDEHAGTENMDAGASGGGAGGGEGAAPPPSGCGCSGTGTELAWLAFGILALARRRPVGSGEARRLPH